MLERSRHDYIELSYVYGGAVLVVLFLSLIAVPIDVSKFGLIIPITEEKKTDLYNSEFFTEVSTTAKAYAVYDIVEKKLIASKDGNAKLPLASLTKVMTAVTALQHHDKNVKITIKEEHIDGAYDLGLKKGQVWTLEELLKYTLVFSSNDGAYAIARTLGGTEEAFVNQMNTDATLFGLGLNFSDPAGLDIGGYIGGMGSAEDVAKLFAIARKLHPEILDATTHARVNVKAGTTAINGIPNTNQKIEALFGAEASKTGFTDEAGGNLAVVVDVALGHPVVIVVLGSTREGRFQDVEKLHQALMKSIN
jgi:D-alanyl-D-alanine carboxypeptidase